MLHVCVCVERAEGMNDECTRGYAYPAYCIPCGKLESLLTYKLNIFTCYIDTLIHTNMMKHTTHHVCIESRTMNVM